MKANTMQKIMAICAAAMCLGSVWAQTAHHNPSPSSPSPLGVWATHSDKTGEVQAHVVITQRGGKLYGRIVQVLDPTAKRGGLCEKCPDDRKNQPMASLEIIRDMNAQAEAGQWSGGRVLDPEDGREYRLKLIPQPDGQSMAMRGYLGPFYRTQIWTRVQP